MPLSQQRRFPRSARSVGAARAFALDTLIRWGIVERHDDVQLAVSELATNALRHGVPPGREFCVGLAVDGAVLRIHVRDSGDGRPEVQAADADACDGRGLFLVKELADDFGVTEHIVGKSVWLDFKLEQPHSDVP
ncbi:ATP-binding protein [Streptomyces sp. NPDC002133]|uniref:ATP-binding protein n=1 Tax=Streptomyces sp. NPDC002133 TaxID=3154409 RepID=UPI00332514C4